MSRDKGFSRLTKNSQAPNQVYGILEVWWRLRKFLWVKEIVRTRNGFLLTDFFCKTNKNLRSANRALSIRWLLSHLKLSISQWNVNKLQTTTISICLSLQKSRAFSNQFSHWKTIHTKLECFLMYLKQNVVVSRDFFKLAS